MKLRVGLKLGWSCGDGCCYDYNHESVTVEATSKQYKRLEQDLKNSDELEVLSSPFGFRELEISEEDENEYNYITYVEIVEGEEELEPKCRCGGEASISEHTCPYSVEMSSVDEDQGLCNCCDECEYQCAMDI